MSDERFVDYWSKTLEKRNENRIVPNDFDDNEEDITIDVGGKTMNVVYDLSDMTLE